MRLALIVSVESTRVALETLVRIGAPPSVLVTLPGSRAARHADYVDLRALGSSLEHPTLEAIDVNAPEVLERLRSLALDYLLVIGWSQLVRAPLRDVPMQGAIGYHPSLLPRDRGRAVIPWTIILGRRETGSSLFWLDEGADSGDLMAQERIPVEPDETAASLYGKHMVALERLLIESVPRLAAATAPRIPQDHQQATWCARRTPDDGWIPWQCDADEIWTLIRATGRPYPGSFTRQGSERVVIWDAALVPEAPYHGMVGQVVALEESGALIACGRGFLRVATISRGGQDLPATVALKLHERLGLMPWKFVAPPET